MGKGKLFYYSGTDEKWKKIIEVAKRRGTTASQILSKAVEDYLNAYDDDPQTKINNYAKSGSITTQQHEATIRSSFLNSPEVSFKNILQTLISEDVEPKERASMGKRIASWLKDKNIQVTY